MTKKIKAHGQRFDIIQLKKAPKQNPTKQMSESWPRWQHSEKSAGIGSIDGQNVHWESDSLPMQLG